ncbi:Cro/CI family transcriptional regulator [Pseudomonas aeruginosa]
MPKLRQYEIERITKGALKVATEQSAA